MDIDALEALEQAATPGPWETAGPRCDDIIRWDGEHDGWNVARCDETADAALIVALRDAAPDLIAAARRADAAEAQVAVLWAEFAWIRALPVVRDDDGDCAFCWGPSADGCDGGHRPDCVYGSGWTDTASAAEAYTARIRAEAAAEAGGQR